jgi:hypothetical protein
MPGFRRPDFNNTRPDFNVDPLEKTAIFAHALTTP